MVRTDVYLLNFDDYYGPTVSADELWVLMKRSKVQFLVRPIWEMNFFKLVRDRVFWVVPWSSVTLILVVDGIP